MVRRGKYTDGYRVISIIVVELLFLFSVCLICFLGTFLKLDRAKTLSLLLVMLAYLIILSIEHFLCLRAWFERILLLLLFFDSLVTFRSNLWKLQYWFNGIVRRKVTLTILSVVFHI